MADDITAIAPVEPDWNAIQERYLGGEELGTIAQDFGLTPQQIAKRAWRYRWTKQQFKLLQEQKDQTEAEVRGCLMVSVLREARCYQREDPPSDPKARMDYGKARMLCYETAAKLFGWCDDPVAKAKPAKCLDV